MNTKASEERRSISFQLILILIGTALIPLAGGNIPNAVTSLRSNLISIIFSIVHGTDTPIASHLAIALPFLFAASLSLSSSRVVYLPSPKVFIPLQAFFIIVFVSIGESHFLGYSILQAVQFFAYGIAFYAVIAGVGRYAGIRLVFQVFISSTTLLAIIGIEEWVQAKATDPSWRIFAHWMNPNALAIVLAVGLLLCLAEINDQKRIGRLLSTIAFSLMGLALFLTQSRGGLLACGIGAIFSIAIYAVKTKSFPARKVIAVFPALCLTGAFVFAAIHSVNNHAAEPGLRLVKASHATGQSTQFRLNLWKGAIPIIKKHPTGVGIGSYAYYSAESGLTTQTVLAHSNYIQLAVETSLLGTVTLLAFIVGTFLTAVKGVWCDPQRNLRLAIVLGAIIAMLFDGLLESDLYFFGSGLLFFILLALALQLAPDGASLEINQPILKRGFPIVSTLIGCGMLYFGTVDTLVSISRGYIARQNIDAAKANVNAAIKICPFWNPALMLRAEISSNLLDRQKYLKEAVHYSPSTKNLRMLGETYASIGSLQDAAKYYVKALRNDPNSLLTLDKLLNAQITLGDTIGKPLFNIG